MSHYLRFLRDVVGGVLLLTFAVFGGGSGFSAEYPALNPEHPARLPVRVDGRLLPREIGCWFPSRENVQKPEGYQLLPDAVGNRAAFDMLALSSRHRSDESIDPEALELQRKAATYAWEKYGIRVLHDDEIRLSRRAFAQRHPDCLAEMLFLQEAPLPQEGEAALAFRRGRMTDHYTHNYPYSVEGGRLVKAWCYQKNAAGEILPETITEVTGASEFSSSREGEELAANVKFSVKPNGESGETSYFCAAVAFAYLYPDLYADEALAFERELILAHRGSDAGGCVKDEWGFLPCYDGVPKRDNIYYSDKMAAAYAEKTSGRSLADDALLMFLPQKGGETERSNAVDTFNRMNLDRVLAYEFQLYALTKELWGPDAFVATHPTWYCQPVANEFRKNSLMWWKHPRDFAQTDEDAPFPCRTGMSKTNGRLWYNEFYADTLGPYQFEVWSDLLGGGRVNIHPFCCQPENPLRNEENFGLLPILDGGVETARRRIRMLNFISDAPLDSPVAVVFGHFGVMNWTRPEFDTVNTDAMALCRQFSLVGWPTDLIPSSQIASQTLAGEPCWRVSDDGFLQYGIQPYRYVVFFAVTDSDRADFDALAQLAAGCRTKIITPAEIPAALEAMKAEALPAQSPWGKRPGMSGFARMVDGTCVWAEASPEAPEGLPLNVCESVALADKNADLPEKSVSVQAEAVGVLACRFDAQGKLTALAGSQIVRFDAGGVTFDLSECGAPIPDIALWRDETGAWQGIFQAPQNDALPEPLQKLTNHWRWLQGE